MSREISLAKILTVVAALVVCGVLLGLAAPAQALPARCTTSGDLFYNFYVPPCDCGCGCPGVGAKLYLCPRPSPPLVGHTYVTYQPLMPSEFLYTHHRNYKTCHCDAPPTHTTVRWHGCGLSGFLPTKWTLTPGLSR